jgi:hypothetical protein
LESKKLRIDASTAKKYEAALEKHPADAWRYYFDAPTSSNVQKLIDAIGGAAGVRREGKQDPEEGFARISRKAMEVWFRVLRTILVMRWSRWISRASFACRCRRARSF